MKISSSDLPKDLTIEKKEISGWGRTNSIISAVAEPVNTEQIIELINTSKSKSIISRGLGRSYGDAAQLKDGIAVNINSLNDLNLNEEEVSLTAGAGASFEQILQYIIPKGFFLPVTPGTKFVTLGGAIAADVHGKNHHRDGSFGKHILSLTIIDKNGNLKVLSPSNKDEEERNMFWNTIGGMGLTGVIVKATFKLIKISTSFMKVDTLRFDNLESLMNAMIKADDKYKYSVAWVDSLSKKGRGVLTCGEHLFLKEIDSENTNDPLFYDPKILGAAPSLLPSGLLNKFTIKLFNEAWFRKSPKSKKNEIQTINQFFYPLDGIKDWNKFYGERGFLQYQFAVPNESSHLIGKVLQILREAGASSFLTVLKRFGDNNINSPMSFPIKGWTLAIDIPASTPNIFETLNGLDNEVINNGGRIYLAKDSRQSSKIFKTSYSFEEIINNPRNKKLLLDTKFSSDMFKRLF